MSEAPHPREVFELKGAEAAEQAWLEALERRRMHHAWLLVGPEGVGKATFAYRAARRLLGARPGPAHGLLGSSPEDPVSRQVAARSHPDLLVLERGTAFLSFVMTLRRIPAAEVQPGAEMQGEVLLQASGGDIDNMEGVAVHTGPDGKPRITIMADNNFNDWERNLLLEFSLPE